MQRFFFRTLEIYADAGSGECLLRDAAVAAIVRRELIALCDWYVETPHWTILPNHFHALVIPQAGCTHALGAIMKRLKGRTAFAIRRIAGSAGPVWQREWFDRWIRTDHEYERTVAYIRQNPVKAGLCLHWIDHPWTQ